MALLKFHLLRVHFFAGYKYARNVTINWKLLPAVAAAAFFVALPGAYLITVVDNSQIKPVIFVLLLAVAIYIYTRKTFGLQEGKNYSFLQQLTLGLIFGFVIGFYDGMIGPGTGTFLILAFISVIGNDFIHASAHAKFYFPAESPFSGTLR